MSLKPALFVGSSREMLRAAYALQAELEYDAHVIIWNQEVSQPSRYTLESLEEQARKSDFAVVLLGDEDLVTSRGKTGPAPRDNVVLEAGIFIGALGRTRCFLLYDRLKYPKMPTDLLGLTPLTYEQREPLRAAVGPACTAIRKELLLQGVREGPQTFGTVVLPENRAAESTGFVSVALRNVATFAGDLSWLGQDLATYRDLRKRDVQIRFLTDTPAAPIIKKAKQLGISFRQYPGGSMAPLKVTVTDADEEGEARALVVRRSVPVRPEGGDVPYRYWMKVYRGPQDYPVIKAMSLLFEALFTKGKPL